ncbi:F-box protein At4g12382-like [Solanum verrucosum]|uniref:F-box protein At4g12382-like n=1 Tax=Solanum verrucosum TaxID=315347 RepID=UPI0020D1CDC2|nr:F-box protein At4g12382-like [Solanum verrucosum]
MEDALWSDCIPSDILGLISSRLVAAEYFVFRAVCKKWRYTSVTPPHCPAQPEKSPCLITLRGDTGIVDFFHPVYNVMTTTSIPIPKLMDSRIRSSKANWLLISHGNHNMFFFNPISNDIIELPDLQEEYENICVWTFSCPPDSSSSACFVVGFDYLVFYEYTFSIC